MQQGDEVEWEEPDWCLMAYGWPCGDTCAGCLIPYLDEVTELGDDPVIASLLHEMVRYDLPAMPRDYPSLNDEPF